METGLYVALSSQIALEKRLTTIADNVANSGTVGFRAGQVKFREVLDQQHQGEIAFVNQGNDYLSERNGGMRQTENSLDFAIRGDAWFNVETPSGPALTRDGRFSLTSFGDLITTEGFPVLDAGGAPIQLATTAGSLSAGSDGLLRVDGKPVAALGLMTANLENGFVRAGGSAVIPASGAQPLVDRAEVSVLQGYVEESNVDAISEMTQLIMLQKNFDSISSLMSKSEDTLTEAIKTLGE